MRDRIGRGERAPDFALPRGGEVSRFYAGVGGAPALLVFDAGDPGTGAAVARAAADAGDVAVHRVSRGAGPEDAEPDSTAFRDPEGHVHGAYGLAPDGAAVVVVLDPAVRVVEVAEAPDAAGVGALLERARASGHDAPPTRAPRHAPVLLVPDALSTELRDRLLAAFAAADPVATGVETMADGRRAEALDDLRKQRRDHVVRDGDLLRELTSHIGRRVIPELERSFSYRASRFEGFKIGCYTAGDAGFFAAHRDNLSDTTAHRRFALSLNLNDDFEGGEIRFPEYGNHLYRPDPGEALVFSGAHLHEVLPVTRGRRFVLLSFLFGTDGR